MQKCFVPKVEFLISKSNKCHVSPCDMNSHGSYKLEKVLNFSSRLEKSLNSVKVLEKYLISLLGLEKSLKFSNLLMPYHFSEKLKDFAEKIGALTMNNWRNSETNGQCNTFEST